MNRKNSVLVQIIFFDAYVCVALVYAYNAELCSSLGNFEYNGKMYNGLERAETYAKLMKENLDNVDNLCRGGAMGDSHPLTIKIYLCK